MAQQAGISTVATRVRTLRQRRGWSAQQLATACAKAGMPSLTRSTIAKLESGARKSVSADEAAALAEALGVPLSELIDPSPSAAVRGQSPTNPFEVPGWPLTRPLTPWQEPLHREYYVDVGGSARAFDTFVRSMSTLTTFASSGQTVLITGGAGTGKSALANRCADWTVQWLDPRGALTVVIDLTTVSPGTDSVEERMSMACQRLFDELRMRNLIQEHTLEFLDSDRNDPHRFLPILPLALVKRVALVVLLPAVDSPDEVTTYASLVRGPVLLLAESSSLGEADAARIANQTPTPLITLDLKRIDSEDIRRFADARLARAGSEDAKAAYESINRMTFFPESVAELQERFHETYERRLSLHAGPQTTQDAITRRQRLGRLLRRARTEAGLTQSAVARTLGCGQAKITKIETTLAFVGLSDLEKLFELYQLPENERTELRALAHDPQDGPARMRPSSMAAFGDLTELEPEAREIRCWHSERIPGPLQSETYCLRLHEGRLTDHAAVNRVLRAWAARSVVFTVPHPPRYRVILSESSLHRMPGGRNPEMVVDQVEHLLSLVDRYDQLELHILTFDADVPFVDSDFEVLSFTREGHTDFAYIEYPGGSRKIRGAHELQSCVEHWNTLHDAALSSADSAAFLRQFATQFSSG